MFGRPKVLSLLGLLGLLAGATLLLPRSGGHSQVRGAEKLVDIRSRASLVHLGSLDSFDKTPGGKKAAGMILEHLKTGEPEPLREALRIYEQIIPSENFGGEYTALVWICEYLLAPPEKKKEKVADPFVAAFHDLLAEKDYAPLREYLERKYDLGETKAEDTVEAMLRHRFHEDFLLFNNPRREQWEKSSKILEALALEKGDVVADIGSGPGYFSFKMARLVGGGGKVYALDTNDMHKDYLSGLVKKLDIKNVEIVTPTLQDISLPEGVKVDCAFMCSLYHVIYTTFTEEERKAFLGSIKRHLKPDGTLVIVDNALVEDTELPYHGPHLARELIIAQLEYSGFTLVDSRQIIPQRYLLVFKPSAATPPSRDVPVEARADGLLEVTSDESLVQYIKPGPGPAFTRAGREAAKVFYRALDKNDREAARSALARYRDLVTREEAGNEYNAFHWYCEYVLASPAERQKILADPAVAEYFERLGGDEFTTVKKYVWHRYLLDRPDEEVGGSPEKGRAGKSEVSEDQMALWHELIVFNNPRRETWERSSKILARIGLKEGEAIADVGCGPGYYTFRFADMVGPRGRVFALETNETMLGYIEQTVKKQAANNVTPVRCYYNDSKLPEDSVDVVFMCSVYHSVYVTTLEKVRQQFLESIKKALKKGGRLVVVDNELAKPGHPPYYGPRIDRRLIIHQLKHYGFRLVSSELVVPQRYVLVFEAE